MKLARILALLAVAATLAGCIRTQAGGEGVFEPTAIQPPPSERGSGLGKAGTEAVTPPDPATARSTRRALAVPSR